MGFFAVGSRNTENAFSEMVCVVRANGKTFLMGLEGRVSAFGLRLMEKWVNG